MNLVFDPSFSLKSNDDTCKCHIDAEGPECISPERT